MVHDEGVKRLGATWQQQCITEVSDSADGVQERDTYTNSTIGSVSVGVCGIHKDSIVGHYYRPNRRVGNHGKLKINNWIVGT